MIETGDDLSPKVWMYTRNSVQIITITRWKNNSKKDDKTSLALPELNWLLMQKEESV
jgi:hypothetical protein